MRPFVEQSSERGRVVRLAGLVCPPALWASAVLLLLLGWPGMEAVGQEAAPDVSEDTAVVEPAGGEAQESSAVRLGEAFRDTWRFLQSYLPKLILGIVALVVGTVIVWLIAALVRWLVSKTTLDNRLARHLEGEEAKRPVGGERLVFWIVFWVLELFVLALFFRFVEMGVVSDMLSRILEQIMDFLPRLLAAGLLLLVGWILATVLRYLTARGLAAAKLDERFKGPAPAEGEAPPRPPLSKTLASVVFWIVLLMFVPGILGALAIEGLTEPLRDTISEVVTYLPNFGLAAIIILLGWLFAGLVRRIVENLMQSLGADRLGERVGLSRVIGKFNLSALIGLTVYVLVLVPVFIAALNALQVESVTGPASEMLRGLLDAVPRIFAVLLILLIAYIGGRLLGRLATAFMEAIRFDRLPAALGLARSASEGAAKPAGEGQAKSAWTPSQVVGYVVLVVIMILAITESCRMLGFGSLVVLLEEFVLFLGRVLLGLAVLALGLYFGNLAAKAIEGSRVARARWLGLGTRVAIIVLAAAMALEKVGVGEDIVQLGFALAFGAVAVAVAIAFGIGGKDAAARQIDEWRQKRAE